MQKNMFSHKTNKTQNDLSPSKQIRHTYQSLNHWQHFQFKLFWEGIVVGIFSGLVISLFCFDQ